MKTALVPALLILASGCGREPITVSREHKEQAPAMALPAAETPAGLRWTAPKGWVETAGGNMRIASFRLPGAAEKAEVTVASFPGDVGGELANVNRWRGQLALPPVQEGALAELRRRVDSKAGPVLIYDFTGEGAERTRLVAAMLKVGGSTWFFKLMGPEAAVEAGRPAFLELVKGLRHDEV